MNNFGHCAPIGCLGFGAIAVAFTFLTKLSPSRLVLFLEVYNAESTFVKPYSGNVLVESDLIFFGELIKRQTMAALQKSAYISLIIASRGLKCTVNFWKLPGIVYN